MAASTAPTIVTAPSDIEAAQYIHSLTGALVTVRVIAFRITDEGAEPITFPNISDDKWAEVQSLGNGYVAAHGRQALNATDLSNAIRNKRPVA